MDNDSTPLELSAEDISLGMANERTVIIESANPCYDGKSIRVRTLRGREFRQITNKIHVGAEDLAGNFAFAIEACKIGIITPGIVPKLEDLDHDIILQVGEEIIAASKPKEDEVEDFSPAKKAN